MEMANWVDGSKEDITNHKAFGTRESLKYQKKERGKMMGKLNFTGLSHVCVIVDDLMAAFSYYKRIWGAIPGQCIPHWKNKGFFECARYIDEADILGIIKYFYFIDKYGLQWEFEQGTPISEIR